MTDEPKEETVSKAEFDRLTTKYHNSEAKLVDLEKKVEAFTKLGDPDEIKGKLEDYEIVKRKKAESSPEDLEAWQKDKEAEIEKNLEKRFNTKFDELTNKIATSETELNKLRIVNPTMLEAAKLFNTDALPLIQTLVERECAFQDGQIVVKGADGKPEYSAKNPKELKGTVEYLEGLAQRYPSCAKAQGSAGGREGGQKMDSNGSGKMTPSQFMALSSAERAKLPAAEQRALSTAALKSM